MKEHQNAFFRAGEIETWGRGIQRILDACREADAPAPKIQYTPGDLWVEFPFAPAYVEAMAGVEQGKDEASATPTVTPTVAPTVRRLLELLKRTPECSSGDIREAFELKDRVYVHKGYIAPAADLGLIEMTIPGKPNSRLQKYRLTAAGRQWLATNHPSRTRVKR